MLPNLNIEEQRAVEDFRQNIVEPSMTKLVIIDFWAEWCEPCKQLAPTLEKVAADYADKGVVLAKIDVDKNKFIAQQFKIQSIPTVYAMFQGKPVADLTQARSESQLKEVLDQILQQLPIESGAADSSAQIAVLLEKAESVFAEGDAAHAANIYAQIIDLAADNVAAWAGLIRAETAAGDVTRAQEILANLPDNVASDPMIAQVKSALALVADSKDSSETAALEAALQAEPENHQARYDLACAQISAGQHEQAADNLLHIIAGERDWNDNIAREKLLTLFEAIGLEDAWVAAQRRRLSLILFG